jgi:hypothetical protein
MNIQRISAARGLCLRLVASASALLLASLAAIGGCSDTGGSWAVPDSGVGDSTVVGSPEAGEDAGEDSGPSQDTGAADAPSVKQDTGGSPETDVTVPPVDSTAPPPDVAAPDTYVAPPDTYVAPDVDATTLEAGMDSAPDVAADEGVDSTVQDAVADSTTHDAPADEGVDSPVADAAADTGVDAPPDSAADVIETADASDAASEASVDSGHADASGDGGSSFGPCTSASQTGCVICNGNTNGACTPTEALIVQYDIDRGFATSAGDDPAASCYACLLSNGCIDDDIGDMGHECGDLSGNFMNATSSVPAVQTCLDTLSCIFNSTASTPGDMLSQFQVGGLPNPSQGCASTANGLTYCFCGPSGGSQSACASSGVTVNGACAAQEVAGVTHAVTDTTDIIGKDFNDTLEPSGMANQIILCGNISSCTQCRKW